MSLELESLEAELEVLEEELGYLQEELEDIQESSDTNSDCMFSQDLIQEDIPITEGKISDLKKNIKNIEDLIYKEKIKEFVDNFLSPQLQSLEADLQKLQKAEEAAEDPELIAEKILITEGKISYLQEKIKKANEGIL